MSFECSLVTNRARPNPVPSMRLSLILLLAATSGRAAPFPLQRQSVDLPAGAGAPLFVDVDGDGRADLFVIDRVQNRLLNFHQRTNGFSAAPDQTIPLPTQTAWIAPFDVDPSPGLE